MYTVDDCAREHHVLMATATTLTTEIEDCLNSDKRDLRVRVRVRASLTLT